MLRHNILIIFLSIFLISCGGGSSSSSSSSKKAYFIDSAIEGVNYFTESKSGLTGSDGGFIFNESDKKVIFKIGDVKIGEYILANLKSDSYVFPTDIANTDRTNIENEHVLKIIRLVQTLDNDQNPNNGIKITDTTRKKVSETNMQLELASSSVNINDLLTLVDNSVKKPFISEHQAKVHFEKTLMDKNVKKEDTIAPFTPYLSHPEFAKETKEKTLTVTLNGEPNTKIYINDELLREKYPTGDYTDIEIRIDNNGQRKIELQTNAQLGSSNDFKIYLEDDSGKKSDVLNFSVKKVEEESGEQNDTIAPKVTSANQVSVNENQDIALQVVASDTSDIYYTIIGGADSDAFEIDSTGLLKFKELPNYDSGKTIYDVNLRVSDSYSNYRDFPIRVTILDVNEIPIFMTPDTVSVYENQQAVMTVNAFDETTVTYSIVNGNDSDVFEIDPSTGVLKFINSYTPDYDTYSGYSLGKKQYNLRVQAFDGEKTGLQDITVNILDENESPIITSSNTAQIIENTLYVTTIESFDETTVTYSIKDGLDKSDFYIDPDSGRLSFNFTKDYEINKHVYNIIVVVSDGFSETADSELALTINLTNEPETLAQVSVFDTQIDETVVIDTIVGKLDIINGDTDVIDNGVVLEGLNNNFFYIDSLNNIRVARNLDFETQAVYNLTVTVENLFGTTTPTTVTIRINDVEETRPVIDRLESTIDENSIGGTTVGQINVLTEGDDNDSIITSYALHGADSSSFEVGSDGVIRVKIGANLDADTKNSYIFQASASNERLTSEYNTVIVRLNDLYDTVPIINDLTTSVNETAVSGFKVGTINITFDGEEINNVKEGITEIILSGSGSENFRVETNGDIYLSDTVNLDHETRTSYNLTATARNSAGDSETVNVVIDITDVDDTKIILSDFSGSIAQNATNLSVGTVTVVNEQDLESNISSFTLLNTDDSVSAEFLITELGEIRLRNGVTLDYDTKSSYTLKAYATNGFGNSNEIVVSIGVFKTPVLNNLTLNVNENLNDTIITSVSDVLVLSNGNNPISNIRLTGSGSEKFTVDLDGQIKTAANANLDREATNGYVYTINAIATNEAGDSNTALITITINDVNEAPVFVTSANLSIDENTTFVKTIVASDELPGVEYSLETGDDASAFTIGLTSGNLELRNAADFETKDEYIVTVRATDDSSETLSSTRTFTITINDLDDTPPEVILTAPNSNEVGAAISDNITITFSEDLDAGTINGTTVNLTKVSDTATPIDISVSLDATNKIITIDPVNDLEDNTFYRIFVKTDITDLIGNNLTEQFTSDFMVGNLVVKDQYTYEVLKSPTTGKNWLDRNLGAYQSCTSTNDILCMGDYYQWGRLADGHQENIDDNVSTPEKIKSTLTSSQGNTYPSVGHSDFVNSYSDWLSIDTNGSNRQTQWSQSNNICPDGFRVPNISELTSDTNSLTTNTTMSHFLKLPTSGLRAYDDGLSADIGFVYLWSHEATSNNANAIYISSAIRSSAQKERANAMPIRCIREE